MFIKQYCTFGGGKRTTKHEDKIAIIMRPKCIFKLSLCAVVFLRKQGTTFSSSIFYKKTNLRMEVSCSVGSNIFTYPKQLSCLHA